MIGRLLRRSRSPSRQLLITVDVEAHPRRATQDHVERLIWGRYPGYQDAGIGRMMDVADAHEVPLVMFLDLCEVETYGEALRDVGREIVRRGHDLQLHAHHEHLPRAWWSARGLSRPRTLNVATDEQASTLFAFLCHERDVIAGAPAPALAYRGGGYRYGPGMLRAMRAHGVELDSSYNADVENQPLRRGALRQFRWDNGLLEVPISTVAGFRRYDGDYPLNWDNGLLDSPAALHRHLDEFYEQLGDDAIAVLVMHSHSFTIFREDGTFGPPDDAEIERFDGFLAGLDRVANAVVVRDVVELARAGRVACGPTVPIADVEHALRAAQAPAAKPRDGGAVAVDAPAPAPKPGVAGTKALGAMDVPPGTPVCGVCGAASFVAFHSTQPRRCSSCNSIERQRVLAALHDGTLGAELPLTGRRALVVGPLNAELRFLTSRGAEVVTLDLREEVKPDVLADVCAMGQVPTGSFDVVLASYVLACAHDVDAALAEMARVLRPDGALLVWEELLAGSPTRELDEDAAQRWYGRDALVRLRLGHFRRFGEADLTRRMSHRFEVAQLSGRDAVTGSEVRWWLCRPSPAAAGTPAG